MDSTPAFLAAPALPSRARARADAQAPSSRRRSVAMAAPLTTYAGGLDRLSADPYSVTRFLFKYPPASFATGDPDAEKDVAIRRAYRQLLGNAYLMDEERAELETVESQYKAGNISAKDFVRAVAKSNAYKSRFFDSCSQFRFIELNFKHILGRAPTEQFEVSTHYQIFAEGGYEAEIDSYIDSPEYEDVFGVDVIPFMRFRGTYAPNSTFNMQCKLEGGWAGSDKRKPTPAWFTATTTAQVSSGLPAIPNAEHPSRFGELPQASLERYRNELEIANAKAAELQTALSKAYDSLSSTRQFLGPFTNMVKDMDITPIYGTAYGDGTVNVFSGQYIGAPAGEWGVSGVETVRGRSRRVAADIGRKEKRLESVKALIVDIEKKIAILEKDLAAPAFTPVVETAEPEPETAPSQAGEDEDEGDTFVPENAAPEAVRREVPVIVASTMADIKTKSVPLPEKPAEAESAGEEGEGALGGKYGVPEFPGDGSEMIIG